MKISVVTTLYRSERFVREFYKRTKAVLAQLDVDHEIVFVNDGSPDRSFDEAMAVARGDRAVVLVDLSRNFGHHKALMTGLRHATGDLVFVVDSDLEEAPENLGLFYDRLMRTPGIDVVYGVRAQRDEPIVRRWGGKAYYALFNFFSETRLPPEQLLSRLMTRRYVDALVAYGESSLVITPLMAYVGFRQVPCEIQRVFKGSSSYTLAARIALTVRSLTAFSARPLYYIVLLGFLSSLAALGLGLWTLGRYAAVGAGVPGWYSIVLSVWFFGGVTVASIGVVGIYVARVFEEVKARPLTVVRQVHRHDAESLPERPALVEMGERRG